LPGLLNYIAKRLLLLIPTVVGVLALTFILIQIIPGDPLVILAGKGKLPESEVLKLRELWGLDKPLIERFFIYLFNIFTFNMGESITVSPGTDVSFLISQTLPHTIELTLLAMLIGAPIGIYLGIKAAKNRGKIADNLVRVGAIFSVSTPVFLLALFLQIIFAVVLGLFSVQWVGVLTPTEITGMYLVDSLITLDFRAFVDALRHYTLPALSLALILASVLSRVTRAGLLETIGQEYIQAAKAKGCSEKDIYYKHAIRNALLPIVTILGLQFGYLLGGAVLTEIIFGMPGIGTLIFNAIINLDYPVIMGTVFLTAILFTLVNLFTDIAYAYLDPRVRSQLVEE